MAAQTIIVTAAAPDPNPVAMATDATALYVGGEFGGGGIDVTISPDGVLPYEPPALASGSIEYHSKGAVHSIAGKTGWFVKARAKRQIGGTVPSALSVTVAFE